MHTVDDQGFLLSRVVTGVPMGRGRRGVVGVPYQKMP